MAAERPAMVSALDEAEGRRGRHFIPELSQTGGIRIPCPDYIFGLALVHLCKGGIPV